MIDEEDAEVVRVSTPRRDIRVTMYCLRMPFCWSILGGPHDSTTERESCAIAVKF